MCATADRFVRRINRGEEWKSPLPLVFSALIGFSIRIHPVLFCPVPFCSVQSSLETTQLASGEPDQFSSRRPDLAPNPFFFFFACAGTPVHRLA